MIELTLLIKKYYPGWTLRVYHDNSIDHTVKCKLECLRDPNGTLLDNVDFCDIENLPGLPFDNFPNQKDYEISSKYLNAWNASFVHAMIWRWFPLSDLFVDVFLSRDSDSIIFQREVDSVNVWLTSNKVAHIMRGKLLIIH